MPPMIRHVSGLEPCPEGLLMQRVEQSAVRHEEQRTVGMLFQPFAEHARGACDGLVPLLGVGRQVLDQPLMRLQAETGLYLVHDEPFKGAEGPLLQLVVKNKRLAEAFRNDLCRPARAQQWARGDQIDLAGQKPLGGIVRLRKSEIVERNIGVALKAALDVPRGLPVAQEIEAPAWQLRSHFGRSRSGIGVSMSSIRRLISSVESFGVTRVRSLSFSPRWASCGTRSTAASTSHCAIRKGNSARTSAPSEPA